MLLYEFLFYVNIFLNIFVVPAAEFKSKKRFVFHVLSILAEFKCKGVWLAITDTFFYLSSSYLYREMDFFFFFLERIAMMY